MAYMPFTTIWLDGGNQRYASLTTRAEDKKSAIEAARQVVKTSGVEVFSLIGVIEGDVDVDMSVEK